MHSRNRFIIILVLLLLIVLLNFFLPQAANVIVSPPNKTVIQGQSFDVDVSIDPQGFEISGAQLDVAFDKSLFSMNKVTEGNLFTQKSASTFFNKGTIDNPAGTAKNIFGVILGPYNISTTGTFIRFNLTAIGQAGKSDIKLSNVLISNTNGTAVPLIVTNGSLNINSAPVMANIGNKSISNGQTLTFTVSATDLNGDLLTYSASNLPPDATFYKSTATFQWTPTQLGVYPNIHFEVTDGVVVDSENITITVNNMSELAVMPSGQTVAFGQDFTLNVSIDPKGTGIAGAQLNIAVNKSIIRIDNIMEGNLFKQGGASTLFNGGIIDNTKGTVTNIYAAVIGPSKVTTRGTFITINATAIGASGTSGFDLSNIVITDQLGASVLYGLTNGTININSPLALTPINNRTVNENQLLSIDIIATGLNVDKLSYSASNLPPGATFNRATRTFIWTPTFLQSGIYPNVRFEITDGVQVISENISITVNNINMPPTLLPRPSNGSIFNETDIIFINAIAVDYDNDTLYYSIKIDGIQVSTSPTYSWPASYSSSGNHEINISVSDGTDVVSTTIQVYINNVIPRYDVNMNGIVEIGDIAVIGQNFNEIITSPYPRYDVNMDGIVNIADLAITGQHFGEATG